MNRKTNFRILAAVAAVSAMAFAGCSSETTAEPGQGKSMSFRVWMGGGSRGSETTTSSLRSIWVSAFAADNTSYFDNVEFKTPAGGGSSVFTSDVDYYWPVDNSELHFYAWSPAETDLTGTLSVAGGGATLTDFTPAASIPAQVDFITAYTTGKKTVNESSGASLVFDHALSRIDVQVKNTGTKYNVSVKGVKIAQVVSKGTFTFPDTPGQNNVALPSSSWALGTDKAVYTETLNTAIITEATEKSVLSVESAGSAAMLIPQKLTAWDPTNDPTNTAAGAYLGVLVNICKADGTQIFPATAGDYDWACVGIDTEWKPGYLYRYVLDFATGAGKTDPGANPPGVDIIGQPIKFNVIVNPWIDANAPSISL